VTTPPEYPSLPAFGDDRPRSLEHAVRRSSRVVVVVQIAAQIAGLGILAVLWRTLGTGPYGLVGMVAPLLALARIVITSGLDVVTIQQSEMSERQVSALFWVNQGLGLLCAAAIAASGPLVASFYRASELRWLTVAMAGTPVAFVLGTQHQALLQRKMRLAALALARFAAMLLGGAAGIGVALAGGGIWALVAQQYAELLSLALLVWTLEPWRPSLVLRGTGSRRLVRFGGHYMVAALMIYLVTNVDKVLVGFFLGTDPLALYGQAFNLAMKPLHVITTPILAVMFPALARAAGHAHEFASLLLGFFRFMALVMLPAGVGLAIVAPEAVRVLGGPQWAEAGPLLRILALLIPAQCFYQAAGSVLAAAGCARRLSLASVAGGAAWGAAFCLGLFWGRALDAPQPMASLYGISLGYTLGLIVVVLPAFLLLTLNTVHVSCRAWLDQLRPALWATLGMAALVGTCHGLFGRAAWWFGPLLPLPDALLLALELAVGVTSYAVFSRRAIGWFLRQAAGGKD